MAVSAVGAATAVYSASQSGEAAEEAAETQAEASGAGIKQTRYQFDKMVELLSPYSEAATGVEAGKFDAAQYLRDNPDVAASPEFKDNPLAHYEKYGRKEGRAFPTTKASKGSLSAQRDLLGLNGPEAQAAAYKQLEQSPIFTGLIKQGETGILQNASATGGLRGGNVQGALAQFRPALLNQVIQQQYGNLGGLTSIGQASAAQQAAGAQQTGATIADLYGQQGAALAGGQLAQSGIQSQLIGNLANIAGFAAGKF